MINKMKHHPMLTIISLFFVLVSITYSLAFTVSLWWFFIILPVLALYIFGFIWADKNELICPECSKSEWDKTKYYCNNCGTLMVFRKKEKVKKGDEPKPGKITVPCCSKGHEVWASDKYCSKCGEKLKD